MAQTLVLIEYDLATHEIRRIIHPEDDAQIVQHPIAPGNGRIEVKHSDFPLEQGRPIYDLSRCADAVERATGRRPPNAPR